MLDQKESNKVGSTDNHMDMSLTDLKKLAKEMGVKYYSSRNKKQICEALGILDQKRSNKYFFKDIKTGEEFGFPSTCIAAKEMGVFSTQITRNIGKTIKIGKKSYSMSKVD